MLRRGLIYYQRCRDWPPSTLPSSPRLFLEHYSPFSLITISTFCFAAPSGTIYPVIPRLGHFLSHFYFIWVSFHPITTLFGSLLSHSCSIWGTIVPLSSFGALLSCYYFIWGTIVPLLFIWGTIVPLLFYWGTTCPIIIYRALCTSNLSSFNLGHYLSFCCYFIWGTMQPH
jgi:hypothetical protein